MPTKCCLARGAKVHYLTLTTALTVDGRPGGQDTCSSQPGKGRQSFYSALHSLWVTALSAHTHSPTKPVSYRLRRAELGAEDPEESSDSCPSLRQSDRQMTVGV